jgi:hypothetical protein
LLLHYFSKEVGIVTHSCLFEKELDHVMEGCRHEDHFLSENGSISTKLTQKIRDHKNLERVMIIIDRTVFSCRTDLNVCDIKMRDLMQNLVTSIKEILSSKMKTSIFIHEWDGLKEDVKKDFFEKTSKDFMIKEMNLGRKQKS